MQNKAMSLSSLRHPLYHEDASGGVLAKTAELKSERGN
jgi:hypothetical protein